MQQTVLELDLRRMLCLRIDFVEGRQISFARLGGKASRYRAAYASSSNLRGNSFVLISKTLEGVKCLLSAVVV